MATLAQPKINTKKARQLRQQATALKNKLFNGVTPYQWVKAGACQKSKDKGMYNKVLSHMADCTSLCIKVSMSMLPPNR